MICCCATIVAPALVSAALNAETTAAATKIDESLAKIAKLYRGRKFREATKVLGETETAINAIALQLTDEERAELDERLGGWRRRSEAAKRLLDAKDSGSNAPSGVSFVKEVAPLLVANCAGCHIRESRGGFSVANFEALSRGSENGTVLFPGDGQSSRLFEVLDTGDMPRGGNRLPDEALVTIRTWIDQGAKFDGPDPAAALAELTMTSDAASTAPAMPALTRPSGQETVSFANDLAGVFVEHCLECHGANNNPRANLNLSSFAGLLAGSDAGALFAPGKPEESLLIGKLKGTAGGARMPMGRDPLPDETIAKIEKWIAEGAAFDGAEPNTPMRQVWETALAANLSADELSAKRVELAAKHWRLALPDASPSTFESKSYYLVGDVSEATLKDIAAVAESQHNKIAIALRIPRGEEWFKGRVTIFVFGKRVEYTEFAKMVEERGLPQEVLGHWRYSGLDPYVCLVLPETEEAVRPHVAIQLAGLGINALGETPSWFSNGLARAITSRVEGRDANVRAWDAKIPESLTTFPNADAFLRADASAGNNAIAAFGFCKTLLEDGARYGRLLTALRAGTPFDMALTEAYGAEPAMLVEVWAKQASQGR
jgi:mono/diheme cytochrome c family protein